MNDESSFCILPEHFTNHYISMADSTADGQVITEQDVDNAMKIIDKAKSVIDQHEKEKNKNKESEPEIISTDKKSIMPVAPMPVVPIGMGYNAY
jgi:predicted Rossmann-fold nucleotide-binding protein